MNAKTKLIALIVAVAALVASGLYFFAAGDSGATDSNASGERSATRKPQTDKQKALAEKRAAARAKRAERRARRGKPIKGGAKNRPMRPGAADGAANDDIDEEQLTATQKAVLHELQEAMDADDLKKVRRAVALFKAPAGSGGLAGEVPKCLREKAVEALGWFGRKAAVDLMGCMADADEDVSSEAFSQFEMAMQDGDMSDLERSELLVTSMKALVDTDQIDSLLSQLNDMRNSRKATTIVTILTEGTAQAKATMQEQLEFYTDDGVTSVESVLTWAKNNPDEETDEETYGGAKAQAKKDAEEAQQQNNADNANAEQDAKDAKAAEAAATANAQQKLEAAVPTVAPAAEQ